MSTPPSPYTSPEPAFTACACGQLVLTRVWVAGDPDTPPGWRPLPAPQTPMGAIHRCAARAAAA